MIRFVDFRNIDRQRFSVLPNTSTSRQIGVVVFNGFALSGTSEIVDFFRSSSVNGRSTQLDNVCYDVYLLSVNGGMVASSSSVFVWTESIEAAPSASHFHALLIAGGPGVGRAVHDDRLVDWLRQACPQSELVVPIAEGSTLLEAAGFGQGAEEEAYVETPGEFAQAHLDTRSINIVNPPNAALSLIQDSLRAEITRQISNSSPSPDDAQLTPNVREMASGGVSEKIRASAQWLEANGARHVTIGEAAQIAAMSERNFLRRFKIEMGITPSDYLLYVRLDMACRLLLNTDLPVDKIARRCGVGSGGRLAKLFRRYLTTTPTEYRSAKRLCKPWADSAR